MRIQRVHTPTDQSAIRQLRREFKVQSRRGSDPRKRILFGEFYNQFENEGIDDVFRPALKARPGLGARDAAQLGMRALQKQGLYRVPGLDYPGQEISHKPWRSLITTVMRDSELRAEFSYDVANRNVSSNLGERYKSLKLLVPLLSERFGRDVRILDIGCSQNQGLKQLRASQVVPYESVRVGQARRGKIPGPGSGDAVFDIGLDRRVNSLLAVSNLAIGRCLGIDKEPINRPDVIEWTKACSFYPSELLDVAKVEKFEILEHSQPYPTQVDFRQIDILDPDCEANIDQLLTEYGLFDAVMFSTMQYQLNEEQRLLADQIAERCVDPERGIIINQDFATVDPNDPSRMTFFEEWDPYTYQTIARDMMNPETLQQLFVWDSGRCEKLQLGAGRLCVGQSLLPVRGLLAA